MVVEKLTPSKGQYYFPKFVYQTSKLYRYSTDCPRVFYILHTYWYDGRKFFVGYFKKSEGIYLIDVETGAFAVNPQDISDPRSVELLIKKFKEKLKKAGMPIHEVVRIFKSNNIDLELWLINSLNM